MGRNRVKPEPTNVPVRLSPEQLALLDRLVDARLLGTSRSEICKRWVIDALERRYPDEFKGGSG